MTLRIYHNPRCSESRERSRCDERPREEWLKLLAQNPFSSSALVVVKGNIARLGRPPEAVKELL